MTTIAQVKTAIITALTNASIKTIEAYSVDQLKAYTTAVVAVGRRELRMKNAGQIDYLGERTDETTQKIVEVYGKRMELSVSLDVYAPRSLGAAECESAAETVAQTLLTSLPGGLKLKALSWGESEWDKTYGMFHLAGTAEYTALFTAEAGEDDTVFTDFILRGVVESND